MPADISVDDDVLIRSRKNQFDGLYGVVITVVAASTFNPVSCTVALRPFSNKPGDPFNVGAVQTVRFRDTEVQRIQTGGGSSSARQGDASIDTDDFPITAGRDRFTPSAAERRDTPGGGYNPVSPQGTLG